MRALLNIFNIQYNYHLFHVVNFTPSGYNYPFGMTMGNRSSVSSADARYKFVGNERDAETGYDYLGHRYYDSWSGRELSVDPFAEKAPSLSPYSYAGDNPVNIIDINGDSTFVTANDNGTYTVNGGNLSGEDDDTGVYIKNSDGTVTLVGNSLTPYSFFDKGNAVFGAVIDPISTEGQDFVNKLIGESPGLISYMMNATERHKYDFKNQGIYQMPIGMNIQQYNYRGSVAANGAFGSARDFGNIAAGMIAGGSGFSWEQARMAFDLLESFQQRRPAIEGPTTQLAQRIGYVQGIKLFVKNLIKSIITKGAIQ